MQRGRIIGTMVPGVYYAWIHKYTQRFHGYVQSVAEISTGVCLNFGYLNGTGRRSVSDVSRTLKIGYLRSGPFQKVHVSTERGKT